MHLYLAPFVLFYIYLPYIFRESSCLDRTNVAQFSAGVEALEQQLVVMGIRSSAKLDPSSNIIRVLIEMYVEIGDHIALQYGGSEAHKKVSVERSESSFHGPIGKVRAQCCVYTILVVPGISSQATHSTFTLASIAQRASHVNS